MTVYGIKNCDTMKKAFDWLNAKGLTYDFHDYKKVGISKEKLQEWLKTYDIFQLINTKGATWRQLSDEQKATIKDNDSAIELMMEKTSVIKRPLVEMDNAVLLGFVPEEWSGKF